MKKIACILFGCISKIDVVICETENAVNKLKFMQREKHLAHTLLLYRIVLRKLFLSKILNS